jgi:hypothetical protein
MIFGRKNELESFGEADIYQSNQKRCCAAEAKVFIG